MVPQQKVAVSNVGLGNNQLNNNARQMKQNSVNNKFVSVANYQKAAPDRFAPYGYTPYIRKSMPPSSVQAVTPQAPPVAPKVESYQPPKLSAVQYGNLVQDDSLPSKPAPEKRAAPEFLNAADLMPTQTMGGVDAPEVIQMDRTMWSNSKVRTQLDADFIRGDLAIAPLQNNGWFQSKYANAANLRAGALAAIGGSNNENAKNVQRLIAAYKGVSPSSFAGAPITGAVSKELGFGPHNESLNVNLNF